jgi:hypothetical protein
MYEYTSTCFDAGLFCGSGRVSRARRGIEEHVCGGSAGADRGSDDVAGGPRKLVRVGEAGSLPFFLLRDRDRESRMRCKSAEYSYNVMFFFLLFVQCRRYYGVVASETVRISPTSYRHPQRPYPRLLELSSYMNAFNAAPPTPNKAAYFTSETSQLCNA